MDKDKPTYRMPLFRDLFKILLTISGGAIVAIVTFAQTLESGIRSKSLFSAGLGLLVTSVICQLLIALTNVIGQGFYWNGENNSNEEDARLARAFGRGAGALIILSIVLTIAGVILLSLFVGKNINT